MNEEELTEEELTEEEVNDFIEHLCRDIFNNSRMIMNATEYLQGRKFFYAETPDDGAFMYFRDIKKARVILSAFTDYTEKKESGEIRQIFICDD